MTPRSLLLAHVWEPQKVDPTGWWMSDKLDGVRAWFDRHIPAGARVAENRS